MTDRLLPIEAHIVPNDDELALHEARRQRFPQFIISLPRQPGRGAEDLLRVNLADILPTDVDPLHIDDVQMADYVREYLRETDQEILEIVNREKFQIYRPEGEQGNYMLGPISDFG
jgi:hypothetical protein